MAVRDLLAHSPSGSLREIGAYAVIGRARQQRAEVEAVVAVAEAAPNQEAASEVVRPAVDLPGALRRRTRLVHAGLAAVIGLLPGLLAGQTPTVTGIRSALGAEEVLVRLPSASLRANRWKLLSARKLDCMP